ncbi:ParA family protein [Longispora sp. NPDC051575]|uniref:ParA family protein n=1 Tax=Longispora sp. NPDC051575 TaxID=3154943 RepID=UPI00342FC598
MAPSPLAFQEHLPPDVLKQLRPALEAIKSSPKLFHTTYGVVNQKGGAGKTATAVTVAAIWALWGLLIRLIDSDPQMSSATYWLLQELILELTLRGMYFGECTLDQATVQTSMEGLLLVPSYENLAQVEYAQLPDTNIALRGAIADSAIPAHMSLIDCRPSLGALTASALVASDQLIIPLNPSGMDLPGLVELSKTRAVIKKRLNPGLSVAALVLTQDTGQTTLAGKIREQLAVDYPDAPRFRIPPSVRIREAPLTGEPLPTFAPRSTANGAYALLAADLLIRRVAAA